MDTPGGFAETFQAETTLADRNLVFESFQKLGLLKKQKDK